MSTPAKRILFLMSDTGGGHRAAAEAIRDALYERYGQLQVQAELVDIYRSMRFPANTMPEFYPWIINHGKRLWTLVYRTSDNRRSSRLTSAITYYYSRDKLRKMVREHPADVVVCVHSVTAQPVMSAYHSFPTRPPFVTVVTDLVSTPIFWYDPRVDRCLVPTQIAFDRGVKFGLKPEQIRVTGLPVHPNFSRAVSDTDRSEMRAELNWDPDLPAVLMVAGGDGMGTLYETTRAIVEKGLKCQIAVITGRNKTLKARLEKAAQSWNKQPIHIYGFVTEMPRLMAAADILVTKAGPATISEACIAGLPMILSDYIPGQEDGNLTYVIENNIGVYAPSPEQVASAVEEWLNEGREALRQRGERARAISNPDAVWKIADEVWVLAHKPPVETRPRG